MDRSTPTLEEGIAPMRIALISGHASPLAVSGGVDVGEQHTHVAELAAALGRRGHEVRVYTRWDEPVDSDPVPIGDGVVVERVPVGPPSRLPEDDLLPFMGAFGRWLADRWDARGAQAARFTPDIVHAHYWASGLAALTATAESRIPVVVTFHTLGCVIRRQAEEGAWGADRLAEDSAADPRIGMERMLGRRADHVVAQYEDEVRELGRLGIRRADTTVIPSGVDVERFTPTGPAAPGPSGGRLRILAIGRLAEWKGFGDLVQALRLVPAAELAIVGGPPPGRLDTDQEAGRLRELARRVDVADRVRLIGAVPRQELPRWYRSADVVVCPPWYETFGLTALEAMACGVAIVAYAVGGLAESVIDGVTGTLVRPRDVPALASALRNLLGDDVRRMSYASAAVDRVRSRYTWDRTAFDLERVYSRTAGVGFLESCNSVSERGTDLSFIDERA